MRCVGLWLGLLLTHSTLASAFIHPTSAATTGTATCQGCADKRQLQHRQQLRQQPGQLRARYDDYDLGIDDSYVTRPSRDGRSARSRNSSSTSRGPSNDDFDLEERRRREVRRRARSRPRGGTGGGFMRTLRELYDDEVGGEDEEGVSRRQILTFAQLGIVGALALNAVGSFIFEDPHDREKPVWRDGGLVSREPYDEAAYITYEGDAADMLDAVVDLKVARTTLTKAAALADRDRYGAADVITQSRALQPQKFSDTCRKLARLAPAEEGRHKQAGATVRSIEDSFDAVWTKASGIRQASMASNIADTIAGIDKLINIILY